MNHVPELNCPLVHVPRVEVCNPLELDELLAWLTRDRQVKQPQRFQRGTLLPDGRLDLCKQSIGFVGTRQVLGALRDNDRVRHLLLGTDAIGDEGARSIADFLETGGVLETVYLGCNLIGPEGAQALCRALALNQQVKGLWLKRNPIGLEGAREIARMLRTNQTLETLDLVNTALEPKGVTIIVEALQENKSLRHLFLGGNGINGASAHSIADYLAANHQLESLFLSNNRLGPAGVELLTGALMKNTNLRRIGLSGNGLQGACIDHCLRRLVGQKTLWWLDLGSSPSTLALGEVPNQLGDESCPALAELIRDNKALGVLETNGNNISSKGFRLLLGALEENHRLVRLTTGKGIAASYRRKAASLLARNRQNLEQETWQPPAYFGAIQSVYR